ncbi:hypothetical protein [Halomarina litorea]|uniref:hypothetical protein n=1 Tax=Halomarina litorea TaxID=2961595 RepID=UPI0020C1DC80|nr:hypothetical protein [Halomarina sp. BCD28]
MSETVPEPVRAFADGVLSAEEGETYEQTFDGETVGVPARFDRESPVARWRFDGRLAVTVHRAGE